jgi:hypothetical protein
MLKALELLKNLGEVLRVSTIYESKAWGVVNQGDFLNCVVKFKTELEPVELLREVKRNRKTGGQERAGKVGTKGNRHRHTPLRKLYPYAQLFGSSPSLPYPEGFCFGTPVRTGAPA